MIAVAAGVIVAGACAAVVGYGVYKGLDESAETKAVLSEFLEHTSGGNTQAAYAMFTSEAQAVTPYADFARMPEASPFRDFEKLNTKGWNINFQSGAETTMEYEGKVTYRRGGTGTLRAILVKQAGTWKIHSLAIQPD